MAKNKETKSRRSVDDGWLRLRMSFNPEKPARLPRASDTAECVLNGAFVGFAGPNAARLSGRFAWRPDGVVFAWSGSALTVRFFGRDIGVIINDGGVNAFLVIVDGVPLPEKVRFRPGRHTVTLVSGLERGIHEVTLYRLSEALFGETRVHGFVLGMDGLPLRQPPRPKRQLLIIGDSISAAFGLEGDGPDAAQRVEDQNHYLSYGALASRRLGCGLTTVAWSGKGVFSNRGADDDRETMSDLWWRVLPSEDTQVSSSRDFVEDPDAVLINLGTNDLAEQVRDITPLRSKYGRLIHGIRERHPTADLVVAVSPTLNDRWPPGRPSRSIMRDILAEIVEGRRARGESRIHWMEFSEISAEEGFGTLWHPNGRTHRRMASELLSALQQTVSWASDLGD